MFNILLLIGLIIGIFNAVFVLGLCRAAKRADRCLEQHDPRLLGNGPPQRPGAPIALPAVTQGKHVIG